MVNINNCPVCNCASFSPALVCKDHTVSKEDLIINAIFNIKSLGAEMIEKFKKFMPHTIGQASRILRINPAAISVLLVYLCR